MPPVLAYVPVDRLDGRAHVMVDGAPRAGTMLSLSHWPGTPTPELLRDDLSAGICLRARRHVDTWPDGCASASLDHFDADGVIALAVLCVKGVADEHGALLVEAARVGDFGVVTDRRAALVAFALEATGDVDGALDVVTRLAADPEQYESLWGAQAAAYDAACRGLADGWLSITEHPEHDLAVVRVDGEHHAAAAAWEGAPVHRAAVHSATACLRVLTVAGAHIELRYRYESWVRLHSRRPRPRVDLSAVAAELTGREADGARWSFDGAGAITGALRLADDAPSSLEAHEVVDRVQAALAVLDAGEPAWDPYAPVRTP